MVRLTPRVEELWEKARRPLTMFAVGVGLAAPASAFMARTSDMSARRTAATTNTVAATVASLGTAERKDAEMTLGLSRMYEVPVGLAAEIHKAASAEGITPRLAFGLVRTESEFKRTAVSPVGAIGYTQVMPGTARNFKRDATREDLFDGQTNLHIGFRYLKELIDRYDGDVRLALTAYNRGPGIVDRQLKHGRDPENGYATKVLADPATEKLQAQERAAAQVDASASPSRETRHARRHSSARSHRHKAVRHRAGRHVARHSTRRRHRHR